MARTAHCERNTKETAVAVQLNLDGAGECQINTGLPFMDHMMQAFGLYAGFDLNLSVDGDLDVDGHHSMEDAGLVLGKAFAQAGADKRGIARFACVCLPMDEALVRTALDVSGRPCLQCHGLPENRVAGGIDGRLFREFLRAMVNNAGLTVHVDVLRGDEVHHILEAVFKALGTALGQAFSGYCAEGDIPSGKGVVD